jgi:hypothetical protein
MHPKDDVIMHMKGKKKRDYSNMELPRAERNMMHNSSVQNKCKSKMEEYSSSHTRNAQILGACCFQHNYSRFSIHKKCVFTTHALGKHQITVRFTGHSRNVGSQCGT